ncbi:MAG: cytochrome c oxidase subunit 3 family protein [Polyangiaceae bacterium]
MPPETAALPRRGRPPRLLHQFESFEQQRETASLGVWVFLVTEVMFFGALFTAYVVYRWMHPGAFILASRKLDIVLGTLNTAILLTSSLTMALAVRFAQVDRGRLAAFLLLCTIVLGSVFLGIKAHEYHEKFVEHLVPGPLFSSEFPDPRGAQLFFCLYFGMTGLHAIHMIVGVGLLIGLLIPTFRGWFSAQAHGFIEGTGLYWHFVDIVWIFLFPLLYLVGRHV